MTAFLPIRPKTAVAALLLPVMLLGTLPQWSCGCGKGWLAGRLAAAACSMSANECQHAAHAAPAPQASCCQHKAQACPHRNPPAERSGVAADACRQIAQLNTAVTPRLEVVADCDEPAPVIGLTPTPTRDLAQAFVLHATPFRPGSTPNLLDWLHRLLI